MDIRAIAVQVNVEKAIKSIEAAANNGAVMIDFSVMPPLMSLDEMPVYLLEDMRESIQSAFSFELGFEGDVVTWS